jgi:hypothetical protein
MFGSDRVLSDHDNAMGLLPVESEPDISIGLLGFSSLLFLAMAEHYVFQAGKMIQASLIST